MGVAVVEAGAVGLSCGLGINDYRKTSSIPNWPSAQRVVLIGTFLVFLQVLDGIFTSIGIMRFGLSVEGNPLLRALMEEFGHVPTLAASKIIAMCVILGLTCVAQRLAWVRNAMGAVTCVYLFAAVLPWTYILFFERI